MKKSLSLILCFILLFAAFSPAAISSSAAAYEYTTWKQADPRWGSITFGSVGDTIAKTGCAITAISILMVHTGAASTDPSVFNPGVLCKWMNANGGFTSQGWIYWEKAGSYLSTFKYYTASELSGTQAQKANAINSFINQGYGVIVMVNNGGHYVAVNKVENGVVHIFDSAGRNYTNLFQYDESGVTKVRLYKGPKTAIGDGSSGTPGTNDPGTVTPDTTVGALGTGTYVIKTNDGDGVNVRTGPSTTYVKVDALPNGTAVKITMVSGNWGYLVYSSTIKGWICLDYATMTVPDFIGVSVTPPTKLKYVVGESLNTAGMAVYALYSDGNKKLLSSGYTLSGYKNTFGTHVVTVTYNSKSAIFSVTVNTASTYYTGSYKITSTNGVNMRTSASYDGAKVAILSYDANFIVTEVSGIWGYTTVNAYSGWVCLDYAKFITPAFVNLSVTPYATCFLTGMIIDMRYFEIYKNYSNNTRTSVTDFEIVCDTSKVGTQTLTLKLRTGEKVSMKVKIFDEIPKGDSNFDGETNGIDALLVLQYSVGKMTDDDIYVSVCDVTGDGKVNGDDALSLLQFSVGKIKELK